MELKKADSRELIDFIGTYNWENGFSFPEKIIESKKCELGIALQIFYLLDGYSFLNKNKSSNSEWTEFISKLYMNIIENKYTQGTHTYKIPLTKTQIFNLKAIGVPKIFLKDVE